DALIAFWLEHGRGGWRDGLYWLCDPAPLMPILRSLFRDDPEIDAELLVPFFRDAFGMIKAWHPSLKIVTIDVNLGSVSNTNITTQRINGIRYYDDNHAVSSGATSSLTSIDGWVSAVTGQPVFAEVLQRLGPIHEQEVYVMAPHFRMGGMGEPADFSVGGLIEYLGFLIQIGPFERSQYFSPQDGGRGAFGHTDVVRTIGYDRVIE
ncbi:GAD-like domain-containing protein, partial [Roseinatronobacter alkalisoli]